MIDDRYIQWVQKHIKYAWLLDKENGILNYFLIVEKVSNIYIYVCVHEPSFFHSSI